MTEGILKDALFVCLKKSFKLALIVGTVLSLVNQGEVISPHSFEFSDTLRV